MYRRRVRPESPLRDPTRVLASRRRQDSVRHTVARVRARVSGARARSRRSGREKRVRKWARSTHATAFAPDFFPFDGAFNACQLRNVRGFGRRVHRRRMTKQSWNGFSSSTQTPTQETLRIPFFRIIQTPSTLKEKCENQDAEKTKGSRSPVFRMNLEQFSPVERGFLPFAFFGLSVKTHAAEMDAERAPPSIRTRRLPATFSSTHPPHVP